MVPNGKAQVLVIFCGEQKPIELGVNSGHSAFVHGEGVLPSSSS